MVTVDQSAGVYLSVLQITYSCYSYRLCALSSTSVSAFTYNCTLKYVTSSQKNACRKAESNLFNLKSLWSVHRRKCMEAGDGVDMDNGWGHINHQLPHTAVRSKATGTCPRSLTISRPPRRNSSHRCTCSQVTLLHCDALTHISNSTASSLIGVNFLTPCLHCVLPIFRRRLSMTFPWPQNENPWPIGTTYISK